MLRKITICVTILLLLIAFLWAQSPAGGFIENEQQTEV
jgi:hypothetical protein